MVTQTPAKGVYDLIQSSLSSGGWRVGVGQFTDKPDTQVICSDGPGMDSNPKWLLDFVTVQVMVRGLRQGGYDDAFRKAREAYDRLVGIDPVVVNSDRWDGIINIGLPHYIGQDPNGCPLIAANYRIIIEPAASPETHREPL